MTKIRYRDHLIENKSAVKMTLKNVKFKNGHPNTVYWKKRQNLQYWARRLKLDSSYCQKLAAKGEKSIKN